jgi:nucleoid-associated protein YgaU
LAASPEAALGAAAGCLAWLVAAWLGLVCFGIIVVRCLPEASRSGAARRLVLLAPRALRPLMRRAVQVALGGAIVLGPAAPALAAGSLPPVPAPVVAPVESPPPVLDWVTPAPAAPPAAVTPTAPAVTAIPGGERIHQVVSGDTLWGLAAAELGPGASDAKISRAWQQIYARNRTVVGPDPSFLLPGELLAVGQL